MGDAQWYAGGGDLNRDVHCPFSTPEEVLTRDAMKEAFDIDVEVRVDATGGTYIKC